ncbi:purine permease 1-like [Prosopis cineraria]|uniref:purine permease 1-like n=1 Tax=Prosopis cineraria TaxID=364024 RepID=UPI00241001E7|nr:purine permease 1-like [Prosopis cineraria]
MIPSYFSFFTCNRHWLVSFCIFSLVCPSTVCCSSFSPPPSSHRSQAPHLQHLGTSGGLLISCLYFLWRQTRLALHWLETGRFLVCLLPLFISFIRNHLSRQAKPFVSVNVCLLLLAFIIGVLTDLDDYLHAYGLTRLPISTSALIITTQLAFTVAFAFLLIRRKFTLFSINAVILLTTGVGVLALHSSGDHPQGESTK